MIAFFGIVEPLSKSHHGAARNRGVAEVQEAFRRDPEVQVLLATDAAGEDPNRLEQRFARIHRIGQTEVCHL
jgi:hypothetical protein